MSWRDWLRRRARLEFGDVEPPPACLLRLHPPQKRPGLILTELYEKSKAASIQIPAL